MVAGGPEAGWYFDPNNDDRERYWNGVEWTDHARPAQSAAPPAAGPSPFAVTQVVPTPQAYVANPEPAAAQPDPGPPDAWSVKGPPVYTAGGYVGEQSNTPAATQPAAFRVGEWARIIAGGERFVGRIGEIGAIDSNGNIVLDLTSELSYRFRPEHLEPAAEPPTARAAGFRVGGWARVTVGDSPNRGRVGKVISIDRDGDVWLKFKKSWGAFGFRPELLVPVPSENG